MNEYDSGSGATAQKRNVHRGLDGKTQYLWLRLRSNVTMRQAIETMAAGVETRECESARWNGRLPGTSLPAR